MMTTIEPASHQLVRASTAAPTTTTTTVMPARSPSPESVTRRAARSSTPTRSGRRGRPWPRGRLPPGRLPAQRSSRVHRLGRWRSAPGPTRRTASPSPPPEASAPAAPGGSRARRTSGAWRGASRRSRPGRVRSHHGPPARGRCSQEPGREGAADRGPAAHEHGVEVLPSRATTARLSFAVAIASSPAVAKVHREPYADAGSSRSKGGVPTEPAPADLLLRPVRSAVDGGRHGVRPITTAPEREVPAEEPLVVGVVGEGPRVQASPPSPGRCPAGSA